MRHFQEGLDELKSTLVGMAGLAEEQVRKAVQALIDRNTDLAQEVVERMLAAAPTLPSPASFRNSRRLATLASCSFFIASPPIVDAPSRGRRRRKSAESETLSSSAVARARCCPVTSVTATL